MNRSISFFILFFISIWNAVGQASVDWAGPDKVACGEKGVQLGVMTSCPDCCFSWSPTDGLDDATIQNPTARPKKETTYTVVVADKDLRWKKSDAVKVELYFGEILFIPDHLVQGTEEIVLAKLQKNVGNFSTTWSFQGENLGCTIDPTPGDYNRATLTAGDEYGKLQVKVQKNADPECYFLATLPVNNGVKDLRVIDLNTPNRFAETGQTLYLVSNTPVDWKARLIAIPNEGGFANGNPIYKQDAYGSPLPLSGEDDQIVEDIATPSEKHSDYLAGDFSDYEPRIKVIRKIPVESPSMLPGLITALVQYWQDIQFAMDWSNGDYQALGEAPGGPPADEPLCAAPDPFDLSFNFNLVAKDIDVEKYGSPDLGVKKECGIDLGVTSFGRIFHPYFTRSLVVGGLGLCTEVYVGYETSALLHLSLAKDESLQDQSWTTNNPQIELSLSGGAGFSATLLSGTGYNLTSSGSGSAAVKTFIEYQKDTKRIVTYGKLLPLTIKIEATVVSETNMGETIPIFNLFSKEIVLYEGFAFPPVTLYQF